MSPEDARLEPPDMRRCMGEFKDPHQPFRLGFPPPKWQRCDRAPTYMCVEGVRGPDGCYGAMTLCRSCKTILEHHQHGVGAPNRRVFCGVPDRAVRFVPLAPFKAAHRLGGDEAVRAMINGRA